MEAANEKHESVARGWPTAGLVEALAINAAIVEMARMGLARAPSPDERAFAVACAEEINRRLPVPT